MTEPKASFENPRVGSKHPNKQPHVNRPSERIPAIQEVEEDSTTSPTGESQFRDVRQLYTPKRNIAPLVQDTIVHAAGDPLALQVQRSKKPKLESPLPPAIQVPTLIGIFDARIESTVRQGDGKQADVGDPAPFWGSIGTQNANWGDPRSNRVFDGTKGVSGGQEVVVYGGNRFIQMDGVDDLYFHVGRINQEIQLQPPFSSTITLNLGTEKPMLRPENFLLHYLFRPTATPGADLDPVMGTGVFQPFFGTAILEAFFGFDTSRRVIFSVSNDGTLGDVTALAPSASLSLNTNYLITIQHNAFSLNTNFFINGVLEGTITQALPGLGLVDDWLVVMQSSQAPYALSYMEFWGNQTTPQQIIQNIDASPSNSFPSAYNIDLGDFT